MAQILVLSTQQAHAYVVAFGGVFQPVELVHQHVKHFFGAVAAFAPVLRYLIPRKAESFDGFLCGSVAHSDVELLHRVAELIDAPCARLDAVRQHVEHVVGAVPGVLKLDAVLVDRVQKVVVLVESVLCALHYEIKGLLGGYAKLIHEAVHGPHTFHGVEAEHVLQRDRVLGDFRQRSVVEVVRHLDHGAELFGHVAEALAVVGVVNLVHNVLEALHFGGRGPGSGLQHSQSGVALGRQFLEGFHRLVDRLGCKVSNNIFQNGVAFAGVLGLLPGVLHGVTETVGGLLRVVEPLPVLVQFPGQAADPPRELLGFVGAFALFEHEVGVFPLQRFEVALLLAYGFLQGLVGVAGVALRVDQVSGGTLGSFEGVPVLVQFVG